MEITLEQYGKSAKYLPRQRGNASMSHLQRVNAILHVMENGCKWRALPGRIHNENSYVAASGRAAVSFSLSRGNASDRPERRRLPSVAPHDKIHRPLIMDRAYEGDETRALAIKRGHVPVVPPKQSGKLPREYGEEP